MIFKGRKSGSQRTPDLTKKLLKWKAGKGGSEMSQRNHYDGGLKMKVVFEILKGEKTASQIASHYRVHPNQITKWKKQAIEGLQDVFSRKNAPADGELTAELYQQIGQLKVELDWLKI